jgi:hypothetical protein
MTRIDELKREAQAMQAYLEVNVGGGDINELIDRLDNLGVYYARSGAMHAEIVGLIDSATIWSLSVSCPHPWCRNTSREQRQISTA